MAALTAVANCQVPPAGAKALIPRIISWPLSAAVDNLPKLMARPSLQAEIILLARPRGAAGGWENTGMKLFMTPQGHQSSKLVLVVARSGGGPSGQAP